MRLDKARTALNGICPYFTMFPLRFPLSILQKHTFSHETVLDPFCGRGTTNFAAKLLGLRSLGVDSSRVAVAITAAKLVHVRLSEILCEARRILLGTEPDEIPNGEFWQWAYDSRVLFELCKFRTALLADCLSPARVALRGIILGALHGPCQKTFQSYFSNQTPRTYAPKPNYAIRYWRKHNLLPMKVDVLKIIEHKAHRYYLTSQPGYGEVRLQDSREADALLPANDGQFFDWVITSPPYYGMRTYIPDQWLRGWFLGGSDRVDYGNQRQVVHSSPDDFATDLRVVWGNSAQACHPGATMVVRFGGIRDRRADPLDVIRFSLKESQWRLRMIHGAGSALDGKRQAETFLRKKTLPLVEYDLWATLE